VVASHRVDQSPPRRQIPVFINSRDRVTPLADMVAWLERAGVEEIYIIDNDSAYEPLLAYYERSPHTVLRLGHNAGKAALWSEPGIFDLTRDRFFAYSDSDIVPDPACPLDALGVFVDLLARYRGINKAGFGFRYDDIPDHYLHKKYAVAVEASQCAWPLERGVYYGYIDTAFAVYRPGAGLKPHWAARTRYPYVARHTSYYLDLDNLDDEDAFYLRRSEESRVLGEFSHWATRELFGEDKKDFTLPGPIARVRWRLRGAHAVRTRTPWG